MKHVDSRSILSHALRHPETWPPEFSSWNYAIADQCAYGLARIMGIANVDEIVPLNVFSRAHIERGIPMNEVSPSMIADDLDALVEVE